MAQIQFRIHPSVGIARMGNSREAYYLASDFPNFLQEQFSSLRLRPQPRTLPGAEPVSTDYTVYNVFAEAQTAAPDRFKDANHAVLPQAARFRVYAYVFNNPDDRHPSRVFEVTSEHAEITWSVQLANLKAEYSNEDAFKNLENATPVSLGTADHQPQGGVSRRPVRPDPTPGANPVQRPPLGYMFLERKADGEQINGRLHLIGNHGETAYIGTDIDDQVGSGLGNLWTDDWFDSQADGPVTAMITPKANGTALRAAAGLKDTPTVAFLSPEAEDPLAFDPAVQNGIPAMRAWAVVGLPNYTPDFGHFVSLWDLALGQSFITVHENAIFNQATRHKRIVRNHETDTYRTTDYRVHIHPQLCLFGDVNSVSGSTIRDPGHNTTTPDGPAIDPNDKRRDEEVRDAQLARGGVPVNPRDPTMRNRLMDPADLRDDDPRHPIVQWLKVAILERLRVPTTLYQDQRKFIEGNQANTHEFPRHLGRRENYFPGIDFSRIKETDVPASVATDLPGSYRSTTNEMVPGSLKAYHNRVKRPGQMCGAGGPPTMGTGEDHPHGYDDEALRHLDDMYWPINAKNMPLLRELAYTSIQYTHFQVWSVTPAALENVFDLIVPPDKVTPLTQNHDPDMLFDHLAGNAPRYMPALIDMASLGTMLGGSFLPGIEVGLEGGRRENWTPYHGATPHFPDLRIQTSTRQDESFPGILTKDLSIPWQRDYVACHEEYWPTARPGRAVGVAGRNPHQWMIVRNTTAPDPERYNAYYDRYWTELGFIRRQDDQKTGAVTFLEQERTGRVPDPEPIGPPPPGPPPVPPGPAPRRP
ncbi:MAG: LodA/GoxA family CTQ-dependent oxidase [Pseudomonadota bacterium]